METTSSRLEITIFGKKMEIVVIEQIILTILGIVIVLENLVVVLASIRNKSLRENTHYNLVISLSVCDFIVGLNLLLYGNLIAPNDNSSNNKIYTVCGVYYRISSATYQLSLLQTLCISLNRYLVITESKLHHLLWNGRRKYVLFFVMWMMTFLLNSSILTFVIQGCDINSIFGNTVYAAMYGSFQALTFSLTFVLYFLTLCKIYKIQIKTTSNLERVDENERQNIRTRKRMVKSMKVVSLILITFMISVLPAVVLALKGVSSRLDMCILVGFSAFHSAINPAIYCTQIKDLNKEIRAMFRIRT